MCFSKIAVKKSGYRACLRDAKVLKQYRCVMDSRVSSTYITKNPYFAKKCAWIFIRGHYVSRDAKSFPRARLEENCELQGADMSKDKYTSTLSRQMEAIVFIILQILFNTPGKVFTNSFLFTALDYHFSVFSDTILRTRKHVPFSVTTTQCLNC